MMKVASMWSLQHTFTSSKACWPFTANPIVYPSIVQSDSDAHFMVDVHKISDPTNKRTSKFGARNPGTAGWQGTGELDENDVIDDPNKRNLRVARSERQRLDRAIATALASPILFAHNSKVIKPVDVAKLNSLATLMKQKNPSDPAVPLFISGAASAEGGSAHNQTLSEDRANAVRDVLQAAGGVHIL
jgi:outer membrane protein OmpA-like peptidoglycan-associated protein